MVKLGIEINEKGQDIKVKLIDPTEKQLDGATDNEKFLAQKFKDLFDDKLLALLQEEFDNK